MPYSLFDNNSFSAYPVLKGFQVIHADSFVTEKNSEGKSVKFIPENFFDATENPWAVNKNAYSKKIYIKADKWRHIRLTAVFRLLLAIFAATSQPFEDVALLFEYKPCIFI